jgi:hypothetical protein
MTSLPSSIDLDVSGDEPLEVSASSIAVAGRPDIAGSNRIRIEGPARVTFMMQQRQETRLTVLMAGLYWLFFLLERVSIAFYVRDALVKRVSRWASAQFMDCYVLGWLMLELCLYKYATRLSLSVLLAVALYRLTELTQAYANVVVFHRLRHDVATLGPYRIVSHWRTFVIGVFNLVEGALLYGLIDFSVAKTWSGAITGISSSWDALYFSFVTITTLGYGDIQPAGFGRLIATVEAVWGLLFGIALLGRFVAALPADRALDDSGT